MLKKRSLSTQFALVFLAMVILVGAAFYRILDRIYVSQLKRQAETVADNVDAFGTWVAQYGRVWVKENNQSYLGHLPLFEIEEETAAGSKGGYKPVNFYSKNPALAQRELSEVVNRSASPAKFRMTSHNVMNPANQPDTFEEVALREVRENRLKEYFAMTGSEFRYARTLYHKASCINCHGEPAKAPADVRSRYGIANGYNFKEGDVAGVISVRIPAQSFWDVALGVVGVWQLGLISSAFLVAMVFVRFAVVRPLTKLTGATENISRGKPADLGVGGLRGRSRNELHQLAMATDRLRASINLAMQRLTSKGPTEPSLR